MITYKTDKTEFLMDSVAPLGLNFINKTYFNKRVIAYIPILCIFGGSCTIYKSIQQIHRFVIKNQDHQVVERRVDKDNKESLYSRHVSFNSKERAKIFGLSLSLFLRGTIELCQLGIIFLPFDVLSDSLRVS